MTRSPKNNKPKQPGSKGDEPSPEAKRKQMFVGIGMGLAMGLVLSLLTQFWLWLPAGLAMGLATGAIMKPPAE
ncbi:HPP family protein [Leucobacter sp. HY1910]